MSDVSKQWERLSGGAERSGGSISSRRSISPIDERNFDVDNRSKDKEEVFGIEMPILVLVADMEDESRPGIVRTTLG